MDLKIDRLRREAAQYFEMAALSGDEQSRSSMLAIAEQRRRRAMTLAA